MGDDRGYGARVPLPAIRPVPTRTPSHNQLASISAVTGQPAPDIVAEALAKHRPSTNHGKLEAVSDPSLLSSMLTRLTAAERALSLANAELAQKDGQIKALEGKLRAERAADTERSALHAQYVALQRKLHQIETFLADYGMVWVGDDDVEDEDEISSSPKAATGPSEPGSTSESVKVREPTAPRSPRPSGGAKQWSQALSVGDFGATIKFDKIVANVKELNVIAGEGSSKIAQHKDGSTRFSVVESVPLTLYRNGLLMYQGPFRPYSDPTAQLVINDLSDGFFPWELSQRYPSGVPLQLTDKRGEDYKGRDRSEVFLGTGIALGGEHKPSRIVEQPSPTPPTASPAAASSTAAPQGAIHSINTLGQQGQVISAEAFLARIPKAVVQNGKLIDVRAGIAEALRPPAQPKAVVTLVPTVVTEEIKQRLETTEAQRPVTPHDIATLQVKSEDGKNVYVIKLRFTATISDVRKALDKQRGPAALKNYKLICAFPRKALDNDSATLLEEGLTPNATLYMKVP
eukprot:m.350211 g.350211  ORF g.350211 m.350211 type:complete len:517 (+) comp55896_c0_seq1:904-2454(+)